MIKYIAFLIGSLAFAQTNKQMTPLIILPPASHTGGVGGEIRIQDVTGTTFSDIGQGIFGLTIQAANIAAGNIILTPGNTGPGSSVIVLPPRLDVPSLVVQDHAGSPSSQSFALRNSSATNYFTVDMGTGVVTDAALAGSGTRCLQANNSGVVSIFSAGCGGSGSPPFTDANPIMFNAADNTKLLSFALGGFTTGTTRTLTPQNASYILAGTNLVNRFTSTQQFDQFVQFTTSGTVSYQIDGLTTNVLNFRDSSANAQMLLDSSTTFVNLTTPSIRVGSTAAGNIAAQIYGFTGQTADILQVRASFAGSTYLDINSSGDLTLPLFAGAGTQCIETNNSGRVFGTGTACPTPPAAWNSYVPSTTNISGPSTIAAYQTFGHIAFVRFSVAGTPTGIPTFTLPVSPASFLQSFACSIGFGGTTVISGVAYFNSGNLTINQYNNTAYAGIATLWTCNGSYEI